MRIYDLIKKKRDGGTHSKEELRFIIDSYVSGNIPDYQISAWLMAVYFQGMSSEETLEFTQALVQSGDQVDLSAIDGVKVDKHSTGGVGDKTSLIVGPIVAACGLKLAKMSGRGLGHTGGTLDKLEAIPGLSTELSEREFIEQVQKIGLAIIGQTADLAPGDKKLYALRDVTATVDSIPLIAGSIMSKKLAAGSDIIVLDVKCGSGAFMKNVKDAVELAQTMVDIGEGAGRKTAALVTDMDRPLGQCIGNAIEITEVIQVLKDEGPEDLRELCFVLSSELLKLANPESGQDYDALVREAVSSGKALDCFAQMVAAQGGDPHITQDISILPQPKYSAEIIAVQDGWISHMDTETCGIASSMLGAGRLKMDDQIQPAAGIRLHRRSGEQVKKGEILAELYTDDETLLAAAKSKLESAYVFTEEKAESKALILARVYAKDNSKTGLDV
ncbi:MAG: thymidine phosphorylase [Clostridiaceae bacterium]|jgi:pyrimidine-nucleoside phosphorylase|nr:thymidine phosphorylase [Clostridiaceae bacterium]